MASKLTRYTAKLFGSTAGTNRIAEFGSLAAAAPMLYSGSTITPAIIQTLANFLQGWDGAIMSGNAIAFEDLNALCYLFAYQICYLMEMGVPEYDSGTNYFTGSICSSGGLLYTSLADNNSGNALTNNTYWASQNGNQRTTTGADNILQTDSLIRMNTTSGSFTETLPAVASTPLGKKYVIKNVGTGGNTGSVQGNSGQLIDGLNIQVLLSTPTNESITVSNNGTGWDII